MLNTIDISFFRKSFDAGLIGKDTLDEIAAYYASEKEWAERYLLNDVTLLDIAHLDKKTFDRLRSFFAQDPWGLHEKHAALFDAARAAILKRQAT